MAALRHLLRELDDEQAISAHQGGYNLSARIIVLVGVLAVAGTAASWWWFVCCERNCAATDRHAQDLFQRGDPLAALALLDKFDARCNCARFTSGDAPPQYALAQACLRQLFSEGRSVEVQALLAHARGPILKELAGQLVNDPRN
jgi:hypothetical protein